jgi:uncharacterized delta-60 repeat protein
MKRYNGPANKQDEPTAIVLDPLGNAVVTGFSESSAFDVDFYTAKYAASNGALIWERRYDGPAGGRDLPLNIAVDSAGNVAVVGESENGTNNDYYTAKYAAADGTLLWEQRYNSPAKGQDVASRIVFDNAGDVIVTGYSFGLNNDFYTVKYSGTDGSLKWERRYAGAANADDRPSGLAVDNSGSVFVIGSSGGTAYMAKYSGVDGAILWEKNVGLSGALQIDTEGNLIVAGTSFNGSSLDFHTAKYASLDGTLIWERSYDGPDHKNDYVWGMAVDSVGNVVLCGSSYNSAGYSVSSIVKYATADGLLVWQKQYGSPNVLGTALAVAVDSAGDVFVSGNSESPYIIKYAGVDGMVVWEYVDTKYGEKIAVALDGSVTVSGAGGSRYVEDIVTVRYLPPDTTKAALTIPSSDTIMGGTVSVLFSLPQAAQLGSVKLTFQDSVTTRVLTLSDSETAPGSHAFSFAAANPTASPQIASGMSIPDGKHTVILSYSDLSGTPAAPVSSVNVTLDATGPVLNFPASIVQEATGADGAIVVYALNAIDGSGGVATVSSVPVSGARFPLGTTTVHVSATDRAGNTSTGSFPVTVRDTTPPVVSPPANITVGAPTEAGATVTYPAATVTDAVGVTSISYSIPSGSLFPVGTTMVTVTAKDAANNQGTATFTVTVSFPPLPGDADRSFAGTGSVSTNFADFFATESRGRGMVLQRDGKIVVAGYALIGGDYDFALVRYNVDGSLDSSFNGSGKVVTDFGGPNEYGSAVAVQSDGKIVVAGYLNKGNAVYYDYDFAVARYNPNGSLDLTFNGTGKLTTTIGSVPTQDYANSVGVQSDGKILVAGHSNTGSGAEFAIVRYNADGGLDTTFGGTGKLTTRISPFGNDFGYGMALQEDGKIVVVGYTDYNRYITTTDHDFVLVRYNPDGGLDGTFNGTGKVVTSLGNREDHAYGVALQRDGKIVVAGDSNPGNSNPNLTSMAVARYNTNGILDTTFNGTGKAFHSTDLADHAYAVALQADGRIVLGGYSFGLSNQMAIVRFLSNGSLDTSFNGNGSAKTDFETGATGQSVALDGEGRIILAGYTFGAPKFAIARFIGDDSTAEATLIAPVSGATTKSPIAVSFALPETAKAGSVKLVFDDGLEPRTLSLAASQENPGLHSFTFAPANPTGSVEIASGPVIPDGTYTISLSYQDQIGHAEAASAAVTNVVVDTSAPMLTLPEPIIVEATSASGAIAEFSATATDVAGSVNAVASPASGSTFPLGVTTVHVTATDQAGNVSSGDFTITVQDTIAPTISPPPTGFVTLLLLDPSNGTISLPDYVAQANAIDAVGVTSMIQSPGAGTLIGEGTHTVTLAAHDAAGHSAELAFEVTVLAAGSAGLAAKGNVVPEAGADPRIPDGSIWTGFGMPSITTNGLRAGWLATVRTPSSGRFQGIFLGSLPAPNLRIRTGDNATDGSGAIVEELRFTTFREPVFAGDDFAVVAGLSGRHIRAGNDSGIWKSEEGLVREIAREGAVAPGSNNAKFKSFVSIAMPAPAVVFFTAKLSLPTRNLGLWVWTEASGLQFVLREGSSVDAGGTPKTLRSFRALVHVNGSPGHARYDADATMLDVLLMFVDGTTALATVASEGVVNVSQLSGQTEINTHTVARFGMPSSPGNHLEGLTTLATLALDAPNGITTSNNSGVFESSLGGFIAQKGTIAPGGEIGTFKSFGDPVAGTDANDVAVQAFVAGLGNTPRSKDRGVWAYNGELKLVALEGAEPPGAPGTKWKGFSSLSVMNGCGPMFVATLNSGSATVSPANDVGLWATDSTGALQLMFREGDAMDGKKLKSFNLLGSVAGSPGQRRAWTAGDPSRRVIYRATFTDGTSAIRVTAIP